MMKLKRKQNYVDSSVQGALVRRIFMHWCVFFGVSTISILGMQTLLGDPGLTFMQRLSSQMGSFVFIALMILAMFPAFMLDAIRFSNRFVGPIVRFRRHLRELGDQQNSNHCNFRDSDFWTEMAAEFNRIVDLVDAKDNEIASLKAKLAELETTNS